MDKLNFKNDKPKKKLTTRQLVVKDLLNQAREEIIRHEIESKILDKLADELTANEVMVLFEGAINLEDMIKYHKAAMSAAIIRLEMLKEMRDKANNPNFEKKKQEKIDKDIEATRLLMGKLPPLNIKLK